MEKTSISFIFTLSPQNPHVSEPEHVARGRKAVIMSGRKDGTLSNKKCPALQGVMMNSGLTKDERAI